MLGHVSLSTRPDKVKSTRRKKGPPTKVKKEAKKIKTKADLSCQILSLASANHTKGNNAAKALPGSMAPQSFSIFGGVRIKIHATAGDNATSKKQMASVLSHNLAERPKTHVARVNLVNEDFKHHPEWALEASNNIDYCHGVVPSAAEGSQNIGAALILQKHPNIKLMGKAAFVQKLMEYIGSPFALKNAPHESEIFGAKGDEGFQDPTANMDKQYNPRNAKPGNHILVIYASGGWACAGVYQSWLEKGQAKSVVDGTLLPL